MDTNLKTLPICNAREELGLPVGQQTEPWSVR